ncbi:hypothetical protein V8F20_012212 [Naviculisporaceae sp. PSN 640]
MKLNINLPVIILSMICSSVKAAGEIAAKDAYTFTMPSLQGGSDPAVTMTVNLTSVANGGLANYSTRMTESLKGQMPQFIKTITAGTQSCDETCCEEACIALIWIPLGMLICVEECIAAAGDTPPI